MSDLLNQLRAEEKLLLSLCRLEFSQDDKERIGEMMRQVTDWNYFVNMTNEHGIIALCWYNIVETGKSGFIPAENLETLHKGYIASLARNTQIFSLLNDVLEIARKEEIKVILLKGLSLEKNLYGNRGLRQMFDLDILVKREDAIKLRKLLLASGFVSDPMISPLHEKILPSYGKHLPEMYKKGLSVEIHFNLFDRSGDELTALCIERSIAGQADRNEVFFLTVLDEFLYLVKHLNKHEKEGSSQLRLYTDLVLLLSIITDDLFILAEKTGCKEALSEKLLVLKELIMWQKSGAISEKINGVNEDDTIGRFIRFLHYPFDTENNDKSESLLKPLSDLYGFSSKMIFVTGYLFPSLTFMKWRYKARSKVSAIFFYPARWFRMLKLLFTGKL
jgi:hypothetical protein